MLKVSLSTYPLIIAWGGWVTVGIVQLKSFQSYGSRFTAEDANMMYRELDSRLDALPPPHVDEALRDTAREIRATKDMLQEFERDFTKNFVRKDELPDQ